MKKLNQIKEKMKGFTDFYGCSFLDLSEIEEATTEEELLSIIQGYHKHLEYQLCDAQNHLERFSRSLGLEK